MQRGLLQDEKQRVCKARNDFVYNTHLIELISFPLDNNIFSSSEDDIIAPVTHVSVTLDGIPEVMETQQVPETSADSPGASSPEQPKRKKGEFLTCLGHPVSIDGESKYTFY